MIARHNLDAPNDWLDALEVRPVGPQRLSQQVFPPGVRFPDFAHTRRHWRQVGQHIGQQVQVSCHADPEVPARPQPPRSEDGPVQQFAPSVPPIPERFL